MILYKIELKMADKDMKIDSNLKKIITECAKEASLTTVSKKYRRSFSVEDSQPDDYTLIVNINSRDAINPTRSMSTITRAMTRNEDYYDIVKDHIVNGLIFQTRLISEENETILNLSDTEIVSEIISIFFNNDFLPKEKTLASDTAESIRKIVIDYINEKKEL